MAITSLTNRAFVEAQIHSAFILKTLDDHLLPVQLWRNVTDFQRGDQLDIPTVGRTTLQELTENVDPVFTAIDSGTVTLTVTDFVGDAWYITDVMRQDGTNVDALIAARAEGTQIALAEYIETRALAVINAGQTAGANNAINGFSHRYNASGDNDEMEIIDISFASLSLSKANVPEGSRIGIVDPVVATTLTNKFQGSYSVDSNPIMQKLIEQGFTQNHQFVMMLHGFMIFTSNMLPTGSETLLHYDGTGSSSITNGVRNEFFSIASDQHVPLMMAVRQGVETETQRNITKKRDEFVTSYRMAMGDQRVDTLIVIVTHPTNLD
jgi:hypothetical protein